MQPLCGCMYLEAVFQGEQFACTEVQTHLKHEPLTDNDMPWLRLKAAMLSSDITSSLEISNA